MIPAQQVAEQGKVRHAHYLKIPHFLLDDSIYTYAQLNWEARILYSRLLEKLELSIRNNIKDSHGIYFVWYTVEQVTKEFGCGATHAKDLFRKLTDCGLIHKEQQGRGKAAHIYIYYPATVDTLRACKGDTPVVVKGATPAAVKGAAPAAVKGAAPAAIEGAAPAAVKGAAPAATEYTHSINNTNILYTSTTTYEMVAEQIEVDRLCKRFDADLVHQTVCLILDLNERGDTWTQELDHDAVEYALDQCVGNITSINSPRQYLLAVLRDAKANVEIKIGGLYTSKEMRP